MQSIYDEKDFFEAYAKMPRSKGGLTSAGEWYQLRPLIPDLKEAAVLDLGCGYGWHSKYAAEHGAASVLGVDLSKKMIAEAEKRNADGRITYRVCGLDAYDYPAAAYHFVISSLVLHYVEDLDEVYRNVFRTLKPGGVFLFSIEHPVFTSGVNEDWVYDAKGKPQFWPVDDYFSPGKRSTNFLNQTVEKQHHTLTQILMGLIDTGFTIDAVVEAQPSSNMMDIPGMKDELRRPMMLLVRASKPTA